MSIYNYLGQSIVDVYGINDSSLLSCYDINGNEILVGDWHTYDNIYQKAVLDARDEWKAQYRSDLSVIPIMFHTDQHGVLSSSNSDIKNIFQYMGEKAIKWNEISACIGLGDVDISDYSKMEAVLSYIPTIKRIDLWGNHDLWRNNSLIDDQFVVDWSGNFNNSGYINSYAYNQKGIEYHIDTTHNVKYVCLAGWEIDKSKGGDSHYVIGSESMDGIIDMLEANDGYDIVLLSHCNPWGEHNRGMSSSYRMSDSPNGNGDDLYDQPVSINGLGNGVVHPAETSLLTMLTDRNLHQSGTINDSYGNSHTYDFTNCTGKIICGFHGHIHCDAYGWSTGGILQIVIDAMGYDQNPFYFVNIDRTNETVTMWKVRKDGVYQSYTVPFFAD